MSDGNQTMIEALAKRRAEALQAAIRAAGGRLALDTRRKRRGR